jgi:sugar lactone lactonase YvrE
MKSAGKSGVLVLTTLLISCGSNFTIPADTAKSKSHLLQPAGLSKAETAELDKEYLSFNSKALTESYFLRKLLKLIGNDNGEANGDKILKELEFAMFKGETEIPFQAVCESNPDLYITLANITAVRNRRAINGTFDSFMSEADPASAVPVVSTLAGNGASGFHNGNGTNAMFANPTGLAVDSNGYVYVADRSNNMIRKISPGGDVTTIAGDGSESFQDGNGTNAKFSDPSCVALDAAGNVYVTDTFNQRIRKIDLNGEVTTIASGGFHYPVGIAVNPAGTIIYIGDEGNHKIKKISGGQVTILAGSSEGFRDDTGTDAKFDYPDGVALDSAGNVYVADIFNNKIRMVTPQGVVSTFAGSSYGYLDDIGINAKFRIPAGVAIDSDNNVYVGDSDNNRVRKITPDGTVSTLAGTGASGYNDGDASSAVFKRPIGVAVDLQGNVYVADEQGHRIRKIVP